LHRFFGMTYKTESGFEMRNVEFSENRYMRINKLDSVTDGTREFLKKKSKLFLRQLQTEFFEHKENIPAAWSTLS